MTDPRNAIRIVVDLGSWSSKYSLTSILKHVQVKPYTNHEKRSRWYSDWRLWGHSAFWYILCGTKSMSVSRSNSIGDPNPRSWEPYLVEHARNSYLLFISRWGKLARPRGAATMSTKKLIEGQILSWLMTEQILQQSREDIDRQAVRWDDDGWESTVESLIMDDHRWTCSLIEEKKGF